MCRYMCGFLPHRTKPVKFIHEKHLIKWAAIYTIVTHKFPKVLEIMNNTYQAPRRLIKTLTKLKNACSGATGGRSFGYDQTAYCSGVTTLELDTICHDYIVNQQQAIPACLGYGAAPGRPAFQHSICTSVNHVVCHGIPSDSKN